MDREHTCCFTGHRNIPAEKIETVSAKLRKEITQAAADGYTHFICGFAAGADLIFAEAVAATVKYAHSCHLLFFAVFMEAIKSFFTSIHCSKMAASS